MTTMELYLEKHGVSARDVARAGDIAPSSVYAAFSKELGTVPFKYLRALAKAVNKRTAFVVDELETLDNRSYDLEFDDDTQTLVGVLFEDKETYKIAKRATINNIYEGWEPNARDIEILKDTYEKDLTLDEMINEMYPGGR